MESKQSSSTYASVLLVCGLPGSGKSTLVNMLKSSMEKYDKVFLIDYDKIADTIDQFDLQDNAETSTEYLGTESNKPKNTSGHTSFDSNDLYAWRRSREIALGKLKDALHSHFSDRNNHSMLIILDDNFHLKSMRREIYRACQEIVAEFESSIGFVTLYLSTPLEVCMKQNNRRDGKHRIPDDVIRRMAVAIEPPDPSKPYGSFEKFHLTINIQEEKDNKSLLQQIRTCLSEATCIPVPPKNDLSEEQIAKMEAEKMRHREETIKCQLQRIDQLLRKLVGAVGKVDKSKSKMANEARKSILVRHKSTCLESSDDGDLLHEFLHAFLDRDVDQNLNNEKSQLVNSVKIAFTEFVSNDKAK